MWTETTGLHGPCRDLRFLDSGCVLKVIEDHFPSPDDFTLAGRDSPEITAVAYDVIGECGGAGTGFGVRGRAGDLSTQAARRAARSCRLG